MAPPLDHYVFFSSKSPSCQLCPSPAFILPSTGISCNTSHPSQNSAHPQKLYSLYTLNFSLWISALLLVPHGSAQLWRLVPDQLDDDSKSESDASSNISEIFSDNRSGSGSDLALLSFAPKSQFLYLCRLASGQPSTACCALYIASELHITAPIFSVGILGPSSD